jgi:F-type H+-transporting ATPase subunit b
MNLAFEQILTQIVAFLLLLAVLKKFFWKPILNLMEERQKKIVDEFDSIAAQKKEASDLAQEYRDKLKHIEAEAKQMIREGEAKGDALAKQLEQEGQKKAIQLLNDAQKEAKKERAEMRQALKKEVVSLSIAAAQKVIGETLSKEKHQKLIEETIEKMGFKS